MARDSAKFRSRKLDNRRSLPVFRASQLKDLDDVSSLARTIPAVSTGVEKEEEEEHHLQQAITAYTLAVTSGTSTANLIHIPTPDASATIPDEDYDCLYPPISALANRPSTYIRYSTYVEDAIGCSYCMDEEDQAWLLEFNSTRLSAMQESASNDQLTTQLVEPLDENTFEWCMYYLETAMNEEVGWCMVYGFQSELLSQELVTADKVLAQGDIKDFKTRRFLPLVYSHWSRRRLNRQNLPITPYVRIEELSAKNETEPYVCFRKRELRPQRKTRRSDAQSLSQLRKLRNDLEQARALMQLVARREQHKGEMVSIRYLLFERRQSMKSVKRQLGIIEDKDIENPDHESRPARQRVRNNRTATLKIPKNKDREERSDEPTPYELLQRREQEELKRRKEFDEGYEDVTMAPFQPFLPHSGRQFYQDALFLHESVPLLPRARRRIGRGGRVLIDRGISRWLKHHNQDHSLHELRLKRFKYEMLSDEEHEIEMLDNSNICFWPFRARILCEHDQRMLTTTTQLPQVTVPPNPRPPPTHLFPTSFTNTSSFSSTLSPQRQQSQTLPLPSSRHYPITDSAVYTLPTPSPPTLARDDISPTHPKSKLSLENSSLSISRGTPDIEPAPPEETTNKSIATQSLTRAGSAGMRITL